MMEPTCKLLGLLANGHMLLRKKREAAQNLTDQYLFHAASASSEYTLNQNNKQTWW